MKKIIVPVDFSEESITAYKKALYIARAVEGEIIMVHVNKVKTFPAFFSKPKPNDDDEDILQRFEELTREVPNGAIPVKHLIKNGSVAHEINKVAEKHEAYMIVMGCHGHSGFEEFWAGSNAYKVVSHADCPVLTMRGDYKESGIKKIVLPVDITSYSRQKVPFTMDLARYTKAEIHVLGVCTDDSSEFVMKLTSYTSQVCYYLNDFNVKNVSDFIVGSNPTNVTIDYAKRVDADLIAIMTEQESSPINTFVGGYARQMVHHSPIPVLTLHRDLSLEGNVSII